MAQILNRFYIHIGRLDIAKHEQKAGKKEGVVNGVKCHRKDR